MVFSYHSVFLFRSFRSVPFLVVAHCVGSLFIHSLPLCSVYGLVLFQVLSEYLQIFRSSVLGYPDLCPQDIQLLVSSICHRWQWHFNRYLPLDAVPSSRTPSHKLCVSLPPLVSNTTWTSFQKKWIFFICFTLNPYLLSSKWTGVSLKGYRHNWQETEPGEEKVNPLLNTTCNKWQFNRLLKHVQQSIIQLYLQKVTL
jgi:hypothetical protein